MSPYPDWLQMLWSAYQSVTFVCAAIIIGDELRRPQKMMIMNRVWPITALYLAPASLWAYLKSGSKRAELTLGPLLFVTGPLIDSRTVQAVDAITYRSLGVQ